MLTAEQRGDLAERMLPVAAQLACIVHGDGNEQDIRYVLGQLDDVEIPALIVVLAGLVNPDADINDTLAYITWDENGRPTNPGTASGSIRANARNQWTPLVLPEDQLTQALDLHRRGLNYVQIAQLLGEEPHNIRRRIIRAKAKAEAVA
jgi:hypothetical protein